MTRGMVLGKFLPPHAGHVYLCEFARNYVDELTIVVGTLAREPVAGTTRFAWMRELFPFDRVVHLTDENPQHPSEHPEFWSIWKASLERVLPHLPDIVFASDAYGDQLARVLGARFVAVDPGRSVVPVSGTAIRGAPIPHWDYIPRCVRPHYAKRVSIVGPESTGKTTLARTLAERFATAWVPEWARAVLEGRGGALDGLDWGELVRGQIASEEARARDANRMLVCDTDPLATTVWADTLLGACSEELRAVARARRYDLTILTDAGVPWIADEVRYLPQGGAAFFARTKAALQDAGRPYVVVRGTWEERTRTAIDAVGALLVQTP